MSKRPQKNYLPVFTHPEATENALIDAEYALYDVKREIEKLPSDFAILKLLPQINLAWKNVRRSLPCYTEVDYDPAAFERTRALAFHLKELVLELASSKHVKGNEAFDLLADIQAVIMAILNAPLRNCDVGDWEEQIERHKLYCRERVPVCRYVPGSLTCRMCFAEWAQTPYGLNPKTNRRNPNE